MNFKVSIILLLALWVTLASSTMLTLHKDGVGKSEKKDDHPFCPYVRALKQNLDNLGHCDCDSDEEHVGKLVGTKGYDMHHHHCMHCDHCNCPLCDTHRKCGTHCPNCGGHCPNCGGHCPHWTVKCNTLCPHCDAPCSHHEVTTTVHKVPCPICHSTIREQSCYVPHTACHTCNCPPPLVHHPLPIIPHIHPYYPGQHTFLQNNVHLAQSVHRTLI